MFLAYSCFHVICQLSGGDQIRSEVFLPISTAGQKNDMIECSLCFKLLAVQKS